jgi:hypothetical protein
MHMPSISWKENPASAVGQVPHFARGHKRQCQRECEQPKEKERQSDPFQLKTSDMFTFLLLMPEFQSSLSDRAFHLAAHVMNAILVLSTIQLPALVEQPV